MIMGRIQITRKKKKERFMKSKAQLIGALALVLSSLISAPGALAQHSHAHSTESGWKTGMLRLSKPVWAGDVRLKSRMYHVKHVVEGNRHVIVFRLVPLRAGYKEGSMWEEKEVARLTCRVEPVMKSVSNTKMSLRKKVNGEPVIQEIQIAGEKVKHIFSTNAQQ